MNRAKNRSYLMGVVGGYVLYLAYQLFRDRNDPDTTMALWVRILFMAFFAIAGIGLMIYAWKIWKAADRAEREGKEEEPSDDPNAMK